MWLPSLLTASQCQGFPSDLPNCDRCPLSWTCQTHSWRVALWEICQCWFVSGCTMGQPNSSCRRASPKSPCGGRTTIDSVVSVASSNARLAKLEGDTDSDASVASEGNNSTEVVDLVTDEDESDEEWERLWTQWEGAAVSAGSLWHLPTQGMSGSNTSTPSCRTPFADADIPLSDFVNSMNTIYQGVLNGIPYFAKCRSQLGSGPSVSFFFPPFPTAMHGRSVPYCTGLEALEDSQRLPKREKGGNKSRAEKTSQTIHPSKRRKTVELGSPKTISPTRQ